MDLKQLKDHLMLDDLVFAYKNKSYFICPFSDYYSAGETDTSEAEYKTFDVLVNKFIVQGKPLKDVISDIVW